MSQNRNRRIFVIVFIVFTLAVAIFAIDMASRTTAPWNKRKQLERALPGSTTPAFDSISIDSIK